MSRYFKYKHANDLLADSRTLGLDVRLDSDLTPLLAPVRVGGRILGNRLAIQPMEGCDSEPDGAPSELTFRRYRRFGAGGAKLIWGEACAVVPEGRANPRQLVINEATAPALGRLLRDCRSAHREAMGKDDDLLVGLQLTHSGRYSYPRPILAQHDPLLDPRTILDRATGATVTTADPLISDDELDRLQDAFVVAAGLAFGIGFDFVDLKQCHRYLLNELLAARSRQGKYGGSFENRTRFIRDLTSRLRAEFPRAILASRMNIFDGIPYQKGPDGTGIPVPPGSPMTSCWGTSATDPLEADLSEPKALIGLLKGAGLDLLNVSIGNPYASPHLVRPFEYAPPDGYETPEHPLIGVDRHFRLTAELQRAHPDVPIVGSGYSWLQSFALQAGAANVRDGMATFVGIGRGSLSQPDFGRKAIEGKPLEPKKICRTFSYCTALMRSKHNEMGQFPTGCPPFDKEVYGPIWDEAKGPGTG
ncbi:oxidoreductase [Aquisphaera insulae]|uniref:oxidoreductase n=1 Tax=Aquisphaera insulae TaxID=2712864 RepID=UPI0013EAF75B|nr:NADH:flavin oxidoreductase [Aquisphaera insulae]